MRNRGSLLRGRQVSVVVGLLLAPLLGLSTNVHAADPKIIVAEAFGSNEVSIADSSEAPLEFDLTLMNTTALPLREVRIALGDFRSPRLKSVETTVNGQADATLKFRLAASETKVLKIRTEIEKAGSYSASLLITADGETTALPIKVTRVLDPGVDISMPRSAVVAVGLWGGGTFSSEVVLQRTTPIRTSIQPRLRQLLRVPKETVELPAPSAQWSHDAVQLTDDTPKTVPVSFAVPSAGLYKAELEFVLNGTKKLTHPVTLYAREHWAVVLLAIFIGAFLGFISRRLLNVLKPRAVIGQRIAMCLQRLDRLAETVRRDDVALAVLQTVRLHLQRRWNVFSRSRAASDVELENVESKLPLLEFWIAMRNWLPRGLPAEVLAAAFSTLNSVRGMLENPNASKSDVQQQLQELGKLRGDVVTKASQNAAAAIRLIQAGLADRSGRDVDKLRQQLSQLADEIEAQLPLAEAFRRLLVLRLQYVGVLCKVLAGILQDEPPLEMDPGPWNAIRARAEVFLEKAIIASDPETATAAYFAAVRETAYPVVRRLLSVLADRIEKENGAKAVLETMRKRAEELLERMAKKDLTTALEDTLQLCRDYQEAPELMRPAREAATGSRALREGTYARFHPRRPSDQTLLDLDALPGPDGEFVTIPTPGQASRWASGINIGAVLIAVVLTTLMGLHVLWNNDWTWGGPFSFMAAVLWGAGVYGVSFEGVPGLLKKAAA